MKTRFYPLLLLVAMFFTPAYAAECVLPGACEGPRVEMRTNKGTMVIALSEEQAPLTVANFLQYVQEGFFNGVIFHRVIPGFVIQGGGFTPDMQKKSTRPPIQNEAGNGLANAQYTLSMARTNDPHSATSQFFINLADNVPLDRSPGNPGYAVFGEVIEGKEVVDAIAGVATGIVGHYRDVPTEPVIIEQAVVKQ